jgi:DNA-binding NarL/FixJ family response regulator
MLKVLIADDSLLIRERLTAFFSELSGIEVIGEAADVPGAIKATLENEPDIVVLDTRMPGGRSFDVLKNVKKEKPDLVVIILARYPSAKEKKAYLDAGADFFFNKSSDYEQLLEVLKNAETNK